nr:hypothetical protein DA06_23050 [Georgenia sp. SUBG003]
MSDKMTFPAQYVEKLHKERDDMRTRLVAAEARLAAQAEVERLRSENLALHRRIIARAHGLEPIADRLRGEDEESITEDARLIAGNLPWHR